MKGAPGGAFSGPFGGAVAQQGIRLAAKIRAAPSSDVAGQFVPAQPGDHPSENDGCRRSVRSLPGGQGIGLRHGQLAEAGEQSGAEQQEQFLAVQRLPGPGQRHGGEQGAEQGEVEDDAIGRLAVAISRIETKAQAAIRLEAMPTRAIGATAPLGLATSSTPRKPTRVATIMRRVSGSRSTGVRSAA